MLTSLALGAEDVATRPTKPRIPRRRPTKSCRFTEDYSWLSDASKRGDWFDPIKYIPLRPGEPSWYLTLGGEVRERFEGAHDPNFGIQGSSDNSYWLQRLTLLGDAHLGPRVRFFVEGISGEVDGQSQPAPAVQKDPINLQFAFADVVPYLTEDAKALDLARHRPIRLEPRRGGRLVATRAAPNIPFKFERLRVHL